MLPGIVAFALAFHAYLFARLRRRMRAGPLSRWKAVGLFALIGLSPTLLFVGLFLLSVGMEELLSATIISEEFARGTPIIAGLLLLLWVLCGAAFGLYVC